MRRIIMYDLNLQYFVFVFESYYPCGGMDDLQMTSNDLKECIKFIESYDWSCIGGFQIYDTLNKSIVKGSKTHTEILWGEQ
ncbi:MAG: hypothetical protein WC358_08060 [Ignavibacteria bacterium]